MTAQLILLRHGKSDWDTPQDSDFERPVSTRGITEIPLIANKLATLIPQETCIICSPALRTRETLALAQPFWPKCKTVFDERVYEAGTSQLLASLQDYGEHPSVVIIGHNPGLVMLLHLLLQDGSWTSQTAHFPTSTAAVLSSSVAHCGLMKAQGAHLVALLKPKDFISTELPS